MRSARQTTSPRPIPRNFPRSICRLKIITGQLRSRLSALCPSVKWQLAVARMTYTRIVRNKDTCPRSRLKREDGGGGGGIKAAGERVYSVHIRRHCNGALSRAQASRRQELFSQVPASPLWAPSARARALTRAGARSVVDEFSLRATNLPLQKKRLYSRGAFNPDAGFLSRLEAADHLFLRAVRGPAYLQKSISTILTRV